MKTSKRFICPGCSRLEKEAGEEFCQYDASQFLRLRDVLALMRSKYPALNTTSDSVILMRFWADHVKNDPEAMARVKSLAARWRGEEKAAPEHPDHPDPPDPPDPPNLF